MKISVGRKHIRAGLQDRSIDPVVLALEEQAGKNWSVDYNKLTFFVPDSGVSPEAYPVPDNLREWMAIWDAGGNEGPFEFELPMEE